MTDSNFPYFYRDGNEICLGDYIMFRGGDHGFIERIWEPNSHAAKIWENPQGCFMVYCIGTKKCTTFGSDSPDVVGLEHAHCGLELIHRATLHYHTRYSWRLYREFTSKLTRQRMNRKRLQSHSWRGYIRYHFKEYILSLFEMMQAIVCGPGKNVRQLCQQYKTVRR
jgi:hypothetical protein